MHGEPARVRLGIAQEDRQVPATSTSRGDEVPGAEAGDLHDGYTDSDWGGRTKSRKSTSGAVIVLGKHMIKSYSKQRNLLALSSAEAETYGMVTCSAELLGIHSCARDMGLIYKGTIYPDAPRQRFTGTWSFPCTSKVWHVHGTKVTYMHVRDFGCPCKVLHVHGA